MPQRKPSIFKRDFRDGGASACYYRGVIGGMARGRRNGKREKESLFKSAFADIRQETRRGIVAVLALLAGLLLLLAAAGRAGLVGDSLYAFLAELLGLGYYLVPTVLIVLAIALLRSLTRRVGLAKGAGAALLFFAGLGLMEGISPGAGGLVGAAIAGPLASLFELPAALLILGALVVVSLLLIFNAEISIPSLAAFPFFRKRGVEEKIPTVTNFGEGNDEEAPGEEEREKTPEEEREEEPEEEREEDEEEAGEEEPAVTVFGGGKGEHPTPLRSYAGDYSPPPLSLLERDRGKPGVGDVKANANIIKRTLQNFGIRVELDEISIGPSVTRYAIKPAEGVRLSKIVGLQNNLELALAAHPVRIEAPIPGKSLVGIEVPNTAKAIVGLASLLSAEAFGSSTKPLMIALGRDIGGTAHFADLAKMPHLLIAGATGSGKSVAIHAIIASLLFRNSPNVLRFIMIDPKRVELTLYNAIPHLLAPVVTDAKKTILALKWAAKEMDRRYDILETEKVRDIQSYHKNVVEPALERAKKNPAAELPEAMPYIVIVIDELADIMQLYPRELEAAVVRLAQMSRAVGIHLILSTQRPSVNVITGLIKANIPSRIALQVASQIDSRTILDAGGAEKLLGAGDMLYLSGDMGKPLRLQSAFITESEVKKIAGYLAKRYDGILGAELSFSENGAPAEENRLFAALDEEDFGENDPLYEDARAAVVEAGKASTSYLQRKLRIGYARAARLMDLLEERGVIGPADGAKPREILLPRGGGAPERAES